LPVLSEVRAVLVGAVSPPEDSFRVRVLNPDGTPAPDTELIAVPKRPDILTTFYTSRTDQRGVAIGWDTKNIATELTRIDIIRENSPLPDGQYLIFAWARNRYGFADNVPVQRNVTLTIRMAERPGDRPPTFRLTAETASDWTSAMLAGLTDSIGRWVASLAMPWDIVAVQAAGRTVYVTIRPKITASWVASGIVVAVILALIIALALVLKWVFDDISEKLGPTGGFLFLLLLGAAALAVIVGGLAFAVSETKPTTAKLPPPPPPPPPR
jgi:hypothetical protein